LDRSYKTGDPAEIARKDQRDLAKIASRKARNLGMPDAKHKIISAGFTLFGMTGLHRLAAPWTRGAGAILMFHQVRPWTERAFAPNRLLEITPEFLDAVLTRLRSLGFDILSLDAALARLGAPGERPFAVLTFDDGYKDTRDHALPVLEKHKAPFTLYVTTGFAARTARLWWVELEEAIRALPHIEVAVGDLRLRLESATAAQKQAAFATLYRMLRDGPEERLYDVIAKLCVAAKIKSEDLVDDLCLDWAGIEAIARHPLCTIGVHTLTHPRLAKHDDAAFVRRELSESRALIEAHIKKPAPHLAYPVGDATSAGPREFSIARELDFASAVTTRPGMIFPDHAERACALPRLSVNGNWQSLDAFEILVSGAPFALWNLGRRVA
jgi:peptidoglycan/xylan/chitin deacetylase (PgdA/CDA1 family)